MMLLRQIAAIGLSGIGFDAALARSSLTEKLESTARFEVAAPLTDDNGDVASDVSGIACLPLMAAQRVCLSVNDQDESAQCHDPWQTAGSFN